MSYQRLSALALAVISANTAIAAQKVDMNQVSPSILQAYVQPQKSQILLANNSQLSANGLQLLSTTQDQGTIHKRYQQTFNGIPVWGQQVVTHNKSNQSLLAAATNKKTVLSGSLLENIAADKPAIQPASDFSAAAALQFVQQRYQDFHSNQKLVFSQEKSQLVYAQDKQHKIRLAYAIQFKVTSAQQKPKRLFYLIDAQTKAQIAAQNILMHDRQIVEAKGEGGNAKTGEIIYGDDLPRFELSYDDGICDLETPDVKTIDLKHAWVDESPTDVNTSAYEFACQAPDYFHTGDAYKDAYSVEDDAQFYGEAIVAMYKSWYDTAPLNFQLVMRVHYGVDYENAFWDGETMNFGDGGDMFYPLVSLDIAGHEISHGFTEQHSDLYYAGQSGALNESFSDMAGKTAEAFVFGRIPNWGIGSFVVKPGQGYQCGDGTQDALRCMDTPAVDEELPGIHSIANVADYDALEKNSHQLALQEAQELIEEYNLPVQVEWIDNPPDDLNAMQRYYLDQLREEVDSEQASIVVHYASGVFNKVFYELATTPGWDAQKAFQVFLYANKNGYWTAQTNFTDAAQGTIKATQALGYDVDAVKAALTTVGL